MGASITEVNEEVAAGFERFLDESEAPPVQKSVADPVAQDTQPQDGSIQHEENRLEDPEPEKQEENLQAEDRDQQLEGEESQSEADPDADVINTFSDLATSFEVEESELLDHLQIMGREGEDLVPLSQIVSQYRSGFSESQSSRVELEAERTQLRADSDTGMQRLQEVTARLVAKVEKNFTPEGGWDALRSSNPGEYIRLKEMQDSDRKDAEAAIVVMQEETNRRSQEDNAKNDRYVAQQAEKTFRLRPDWKTPVIGKAAHDDINSYLTNNGFDQEQISELVDANSIITVWKAAQYDKAQALRPELKKRLSKLPRKHLKASARDETVRNVAQDKQRKAASDKFRQTGRIEDSLTLFEEHI